MVAGITVHNILRPLSRMRDLCFSRCRHSVTSAARVRGQRNVGHEGVHVLDSRGVLSPRMSAELIGRYSFEAPLPLPPA